MKEVFRQYGGVLIAAAATSAFLVLMGNLGTDADGTVRLKG